MEIFISIVQKFIFRDRDDKKRTNQSLELTPASLKAIYGLLTMGSAMVDSKNNSIAQVSGVSQKTVINTLEKLKKLDYLRGKQNRYKIIDYLKLFERWELGYNETLRSNLPIGTFSPSSHKNFYDLEAEIKEYAVQYGYLIGGELGASIIAQYIRPISATLHLNHKINYRQIVIKLKLKPDEEGNIAFFQTFGSDDNKHHPETWVNPLLIHAELVCTGNSRLKETAQIIYDRYIRQSAGMAMHIEPGMRVLDPVYDWSYRS